MRTFYRIQEKNRVVYLTTDPFAVFNKVNEYKKTGRKITAEMIQEVTKYRFINRIGGNE